MFIVYFACFTAKGIYQENIYGADSIEPCLDTLNALVSRNWKLLNVYLADGQSAKVSLPVDAFDGQPVGKALAQLKEEWKTVLA